MANKVDPSKFGSSAPKLMPEDLEEDAAILTIAKYEEVMVDDDEAEGGKRQSATLKFVETGDKVVWLNKGMVEALVEQLGDDSDKWAGQKCPVERHVATFGNKKYPKVRVMMSEEWDRAFKDAGVRRTRPAGAKR
jgi:hypothetical protein